MLGLTKTKFEKIRLIIFADYSQLISFSKVWNGFKFYTRGVIAPDKKCIMINIFLFLHENNMFWVTDYHIYHKYSDRQAWANSVDPDEMPQNVASHQGLHYLPLIQQFLDTVGSELYLFKF